MVLPNSKLSKSVATYAMLGSVGCQTSRVGSTMLTSNAEDVGATTKLDAAREITLARTTRDLFSTRSSYGRSADAMQSLTSVTIADVGQARCGRDAIALRHNCDEL